MTLQNAHKGIKKIFIAEILQIIAVVIVLFGLLALVGALGAFAETFQAENAMGFLTMGGIMAVIGLFLPILALILNLMGLKQASKDEPDRMSKAFVCTVAAIVLSVIVCICKCMELGTGDLLLILSGEGASDFFNVLVSLAEMGALIFTIMGVSEVTQNIARQDVADMGPKIIVIVVIAAVISIIVDIIGGEVGVVLAIIALLLTLVTYIAFLIFLGRAIKALAKG